MTKRFGLLIVLLGVALLVASPARATTVTFDDIACGYQCTITDGYGGLNWDNFMVVNTVAYTQDSGYLRGVVSPVNVAFNAYANPASFLISSATPINFYSTYLTAAWRTGLNITVEGFLGANLLYTQTVVVSDQLPTLFDFDYFGVDSVKFTSFGGVDAGTIGEGAHFAMDDLTYEPVPEPSTLLLMGAGLLAGARRLRARRP